MGPRPTTLKSLASARWLLGLGVALALVLDGALGGVLAEPQLRAELQVLYRARAALGYGPTVSPRLKVLAYDDKTAAWTGEPLPGVEDLFRLARRAQASGARAVVVPSLMTSAYAGDPETQERIATLARTLRIPVVAGVFLSGREAPGRFAQPLDQPAFSLRRLLPPDAKEHELRAFPAQPRDERYVYGPNEALTRALHLGHMMPWEGAGAFAPLFLRLGPEGVLPHLALGFTDDVRFDGRTLRVDGRPVPVTEDGLALVDFAPRQAYVGGETTSSMLASLKRARAGDLDVPLEAVRAGDVVVLATNMATGSAQFVATPIGTITNNEQLIALVNALLTGEWLTPVLARRPLIFAATLAGAALGALLGSAALFVAVLLLVPVVLGAPVVLGFALGGLFVPWLSPLVAFTITYGLTFGVQHARRMDATRHARLLLEKDLALANSIQDSLRPAERQVYFGRYEVRCLQQKHDALGGDWMAVRTGQEGEVFVAVGDATGKGVQAALVVHAVQSLWAEALGAATFDPGAFLHRVDRTLDALGAKEMHSMTLGILRVAEGGLTYWSAAHLPVVVWRDGQAQNLRAVGGILGMRQGGSMDPKALPLPDGGTGTVALLGSDGVFDGRGCYRTDAVAALVAGIERDGAAHIAGLPHADDRTLVLVRIIDPAPSLAAA